MRFQVEPQLAATPIFREIFISTAHYWNLAAGRTFIDETFDIAVQFKSSAVESQMHVSGTDADVGASGMSFSDPLTGQILSLKVDFGSIPTAQNRDWFAYSLTHELGHALGLGHNFAGSADPLALSYEETITVMDYIKKLTSPRSPKPYDEAIMRHIYQGVMPAKKLLHCNDVQQATIYRCEQYDEGEHSAAALEAIFSVYQKAENAVFLIQDLSRALGQYKCLSAADRKIIRQGITGVLQAMKEQKLNSLSADLWLILDWIPRILDKPIFEANQPEHAAALDRLADWKVPEPSASTHEILKQFEP